MNTKYKSSSKNKCCEMVEILRNIYKDAKCGLDYNSPLELTMALILAAQCTDKRVNQIIPILFEKFPDVYALASAPISEIIKIVKPCGFYINKANSIHETANILIKNFDAKVPNTMEELCTLRGIARKSSNIILQECYDKTVGIAVDTHVTRISRKAGFSNANSQDKIEVELKHKLPKKYWNVVNHVFVLHGREFCIARRPQCDICPISHLCPKNR